jgi:hypothetical protein
LALLLYAAVCGIPKENPIHAVQMVRFARAAQRVFQQVVEGLQPSLGPDTTGKLLLGWLPLEITSHAISSNHVQILE